MALYELATGKLPVRGAADTSNLPAGLAPIIARLMARDPKARYQTARQAREAFESLVGQASRPASSR